MNQKPPLRCLILEARLVECRSPGRGHLWGSVLGGGAAGDWWEVGVVTVLLSTGRKEVAWHSKKPCLAPGLTGVFLPSSDQSYVARGC